MSKIRKCFVPLKTGALNFYLKKGQNFVMFKFIK